MRGLAELGWSDFFSQHLVDSSEVPARVVSEQRAGYRIQTALTECSARISGKMRHTAMARIDMPAVGDWVVVEMPECGGDAIIRRVLPRKSKFSRKEAGGRTEEQIVAANIDFVWIMSSLDDDFNPRRIERYLTLAWESGAAPVIILNKADLSSEVEMRTFEVESLAPGTPVHATSSLTQQGLGELCGYFKEHATVAILGSSGVGKSTLVNALAGREMQKTGRVRQDGKGRHTTTDRQLLRLPAGGLIIDTPGMRELQLWDSPDGLADTFVDIDQLARSCRFSDCRHGGEPGCAVAQAVADGEVPAERLISYQKLQRELAHLERKQDVRARAEERRRIKSIMKSLRHHPKYRR